MLLFVMSLLLLSVSGWRLGLCRFRLLLLMLSLKCRM